MRITLGNLRRIIREALEGYQFEGDIDKLDDEAQKEISEILKEKGVNPGKVQVKESGGSFTLMADGRKFTMNIKDISSGNNSGEKNPQQNSDGNKSGQKSGVKPQQNGQMKA